MFADVNRRPDDLKRRAREPCPHKGMQALNVKKDAAKANWGVALGSSVRRLPKRKHCRSTFNSRHDHGWPAPPVSAKALNRCAIAR